MNIKQQRIAVALTYAGTLPLILSGLGAMAHILSSADASRLTLTYRVIIVSFLAGIPWACYLFHVEKCPRNMLLTNNAVALLSWSTLLVYPSPWSILLQIFCFLYLLVLDFKLTRAKILPTWLYAIRRSATIIVVLMLSIMIGYA